MDNKITNHLKAKISEIAEFLDVDFYGADFIPDSISSLDSLRENSLAFSKSKFDEKLIANVKRICLVVAEPPVSYGDHSYIVVVNPRLAFAKIVKRFFQKPLLFGVGKYTVIHKTAKISKFAKIGNNCTIGKNVIIGDFVEIRNNVSLSGGVRIGENCLIKSNTVIGEEGFGFEFEEDGTPVRLPHIGSVTIKNNVEIGANCIISKGTINNTIIENDVKIDDMVFVAHNCHIGAKTVLIAGAEISGSVWIGEKCWIGPNCSIIQKIKIGKGALVGIGAVVIKDVSEDAVVAGNPAKDLKKDK